MHCSQRPPDLPDLLLRPCWYIIAVSSADWTILLFHSFVWWVAERLPWCLQHTENLCWLCGWSRCIRVRWPLVCKCPLHISHCRLHATIFCWGLGSVVPAREWDCSMHVHCTSTWMNVGRPLWVVVNKLFSFCTFVHIVLQYIWHLKFSPLLSTLHDRIFNLLF